MPIAVEMTLASTSIQGIILTLGIEFNLSPKWANNESM